jgi:hypothetical protein
MWMGDLIRWGCEIVSRWNELEILDDDGDFAVNEGSFSLIRE